MANIIYRASVTPTVPSSTTAKGAPLTNLEVDGNFKSINTDIASRALSGANTDLTSIGGLTTALSLAQGGTGAISVAAGPFAAKGTNTDITSLGGITTPLSVSQGGTGKSTLTGLVKGIGTGAMVAATVRTDYAEPTGSLVTGILKSTTSTGALTIAVAADFPTLNQDTTGNAATATTATTATTAGSVLGVVSSIISTSTTAVNGTYYIATGTLTLTLPLSPVKGNIVGFSNASGSITSVIARNNQNINSLAQDMTVNKAYAAFTLQFSDTTRGWVFI